MSTRGSNQVSGSLRRIPRVISALRAQVSPYRVIEAQSSEAEAIADWIELHFPVIGMQIDWSKVSSSRCIEWSETADLVRAFATIIRDLPSQTTVVVTWSDALYPSLEMPLSSVARVAPEIFESCFDTWIICQAENWCIEAHHEGTLCFGHGRPVLYSWESGKAKCERSVRHHSHSIHFGCGREVFGAFGDMIRIP